MDFIFQNTVSFDISFHAWTVLILLFWCFIGEIGITVPYVLESFWLLIGYNVGTGVLPPGYIIVLWIAAQTGRQAGAFALYRIARFGMPAAEKFFRKIHLDKFFDKLKARAGKVGNASLLSPLSVAFARMVGMRLPMMLVCAGKKQPGTLALGVLLSSIVWDTLYISLGAVFGTALDLGQGYMLLISLGCISVIYLVIYAFRKLFGRRRRPRIAVPCSEVVQIENPPLPLKEARDFQPVVKRPVNKAMALALRLSTALVVVPAIIFNSLGKVFR